MASSKSLTWQEILPAPLYGVLYQLTNRPIAWLSGHLLFGWVHEGLSFPLNLCIIWRFGILFGCNCLILHESKIPFLVEGYLILLWTFLLIHLFVSYIKDLSDMMIHCYLLLNHDEIVWVTTSSWTFGSLFPWVVKDKLDEKPIPFGLTNNNWRWKPGNHF